jgi:hypothetical protein
MPHPTEARQLPGVKGQWILCSDCPPTEADGDDDGDVQVADRNLRSWEFQNWSEVTADRYWLPSSNDSFADDPRPFALPAAPVPEQAATVKRKFVQLVCHPKGTAIYAVADDGTAWISSEELPDWIEMSDLPTREVPNA